MNKTFKILPELPTRMNIIVFISKGFQLRAKKRENRFKLLCADIDNFP